MHDSDRVTAEPEQDLSQVVGEERASQNVVVEADTVHAGGPIEDGPQLSCFFVQSDDREMRKELTLTIVRIFQLDARIYPFLS